MKGRTTLRSYQSSFVVHSSPQNFKRTRTIDQAPEPVQVASALQTFIATSLVVGHNLRAFDAKELRGMGVPIAEECIIDTLTFAYCLHPDSSVTISHFFVKCIEFRRITKSGIPHSTMQVPVVNSYMN